MYMLHVSYSKTPADVEPHIEAHRQWVASAMREGTILFAGVKKSGLGGIIAVKSMPKADLLKLLAEDSYVQADVADYQIVDFDCKAAQPNVAELIGA